MSYTFVPNKSLGQLLNISPKNVTFLNLQFRAQSFNYFLLFHYYVIILILHQQMYFKEHL